MTDTAQAPVPPDTKRHMAEIPSHWLWGPGRAPRFSRSVAFASQDVDRANDALLEALKRGYPKDSAVYVIHHRGSFAGTVAGWDAYGSRVSVTNNVTQKTSKWWAAHVQLIEHTPDGEDAPKGKQEDGKP